MAGTQDTLCALGPPPVLTARLPGGKLTTFTSHSSAAGVAGSQGSTTAGQQPQASLGELCCALLQCPGQLSLEFARGLASLPRFQSRDMVLSSRARPWEAPHPQLPSSVSTLAMDKVVATELFC